MTKKTPKKIGNDDRLDTDLESKDHDIIKDDINELNNLTELDDIAELDSIVELDDIAELDDIVELDNIAELDEINEINNLDEIQNLAELDNLDELDDSDDIDETESINELDVLDELESLELIPTDIQSVEPIDILDNIEKQDKIDDKKSYVNNDITAQYYKNIAQYKPLTLEQELVLGRKIKKGDKNALMELLLANLKFVVSIALKYKNTSVPIPDLINQGNIGLLEAAKRYKPEKKVKFITYAVWWIRQSIISCLSDNIGSVKLSLKHSSLLYKINATSERLTKELKRAPHNDEIAAQLNVSEEQVDAIYRVSKGTLSLDSPISGDNDTSFIDSLEDKGMSTEDLLIQNMLKVSLHDIVSELDEREGKIIALRFGLDGEDSLTLEEVGQKLSISRERVRQLETRALDKLKKKAMKKKLNDYLY